MPIYRATVWRLSGVAEVVEGDAGIQRQVVELHAENEAQFRAEIEDWYINDLDGHVWFGPITKKTEPGLFEKDVTGLWKPQR